MPRFHLPAWAAASCLLLLTPAPVVRAATPERAFWVWNRAQPLTDSERTVLHTAGISRLYWQAGELEFHGGVLGFRRTATLANDDPELAIIPVVRVSTSIRSPEEFSEEALGLALRPLVEDAPGREIQLDFDCPDRLLPVYAGRLRAARKLAGIRRLTITALAGWAGAPARDTLWPAVDAVFPMLYDTQTDSPAPLDAPSPCQPRALLNPAVLASELRAWTRCPIPWYAGLPVFARVTLYDAGGRSHGHLRSWDWEDLVFNPALLLDRPPALGTTVLRAARATTCAQSPVPVGGFVALRTADLPAVQIGIQGAEAAGARGVVFFRLPDPPDPARSTGGGWSLEQLSEAFAVPPPVTAAGARLQLRRAQDGSERWTLRNDSDTDLPARFAAPGRGYGLELQIADGATGWREALPGDFHRVIGAVFNRPAPAVPGAENKATAVAIPLARRLTFWFADLPAHGALTTGLVQLAPGVSPAAVRFRLPSPDQPEATPWQSPE